MTGPTQTGASHVPSGRSQYFAVPGHSEILSDSHGYVSTPSHARSAIPPSATPFSIPNSAFDRRAPDSTDRDDVEYRGGIGDQGVLTWGDFIAQYGEGNWEGQKIPPQPNSGKYGLPCQPDRSSLVHSVTPKNQSLSNNDIISNNAEVCETEPITMSSVVPLSPPSREVRIVSPYHVRTVGSEYFTGQHHSDVESTKPQDISTDHKASISLTSSATSQWGFCDSPFLASEFSTSTSVLRGSDFFSNSTVSTPPSYETDRRTSTHVETLEERLFYRSGYLVAPSPPNELERRSALRRYDLIGTRPDTNCDRIASVAKVVFSTQWVMITLVDTTRIFLKHNPGYNGNFAPRDISFCSHTLLQKTEPLVVLDTLKDWRFANNPYTSTDKTSAHGIPPVRFYAGIPLRTNDGYNIGTFCLVDDIPRPEFTEADVHTLKEFGALVMRELDLHKDKLQVQLRKRIQTSMERFTRECLELDGPIAAHEHLTPEQKMAQVCEVAAKLVKETLGLEGAAIYDVSHFEVLEIGANTPGGGPIKRYHGDAFRGHASSSRTTDSDNAGEVAGENRHEYGRIPALPCLGSAEEDQLSVQNEPLSGEAHSRLASFLATHPDGRIYERVVPSCFKGIVPPNIQYAMVVPIFGIEGNPLLLLSCYMTRRGQHYLEGYELQFLRSVGVIILSAVLKRRLKLADKAKSLFISNISHEFRTPLHGILAAAELLSDSKLTPDQLAYLETVEACGATLVETVNHVLDFSKLSRTSARTIFVPRTIADLTCILEDTIEGCWVGSRARTVHGAADIGSAYSPPPGAPNGASGNFTDHVSTVETVLDIGSRKSGWILRCEKGGIRRVLTNLMNNSLKFTNDGYIHIMLRECVCSPSGPQRVEITVIDSGKGIKEEFLKNHMFQPFSQENPLLTGTGLGLAIVNSIVRSESINGTVEVRSAEGVGTEIKVVMEVESAVDSTEADIRDAPHVYETLPSAMIALVGFDKKHKGQALLRKVVATYLTEWWGLYVVGGDEEVHTAEAEIVLINEDITVVVDRLRRQDISQSLILLTSSRGNGDVASTIQSFECIGGIVKTVYKPCRPSALFDALKKSRKHSGSSTPRMPTSPEQQSIAPVAEPYVSPSGTSKPWEQLHLTSSEPPPAVQRSSAAASSQQNDRPFAVTYIPPEQKHSEAYATKSDIQPYPPSKSSPVGPDIGPREAMRVLVVEDNHVNRALLVQWLRKRGLEYDEAENGQQAVDLFQSRPSRFFSVILMDMSMPILDGFGAVGLIRSIENQRATESGSLKIIRPARIFALSGLADKADKVHAFNSGVDGYLVKPVSFKTLSSLFSRLSDTTSLGDPIDA